MINSTVILSDVLYTLDPASTCCKENECSDEYDIVASEILNDNGTLFDNIRLIFKSSFDIELSKDDTLNIITHFHRAVTEVEQSEGDV